MYALANSLESIVVNDGIRIVYRTYDKVSALVATAALLAEGKQARYYSVPAASKRSAKAQAWHVSVEAAVRHPGGSVATLAYPCIPAI